MMIFDKTGIEEMKKVNDGVEYIFEYVDCGNVYQDVMINFEGNQFTKKESEFKDIKSGADLETYYRFDDEGNYILLARNLDGSLEF